MTQKQTMILKFIEIWFVLEFVLNISTFLIYCYDCFWEKSLILLQIAAHTHFFVYDVVPVVNVIVLLIVSYFFEEKSQIKSLLIKGCGTILLLCVIDLIYRDYIPVNIGALNDYRNIFVFILLPVISIEIVAFEISLKKHKKSLKINTLLEIK